MGKVGYFVRISIPILLSLTALLCLMVVALAGFRAQSGTLRGLDFATIDTSKVDIKVGDDRFHGLPDSWDYSKHKTFYSIYLYNYCSGQIKDNNYEVDFCSKSSHLLFDLLPFWRAWGVSVNKGNVQFYWLANGPKLLYVSYYVAVSFKALEILLASFSGIFHRAKGLLAITSLLCTASTLALSIVAQITYGTLVRRADDEDIPITAKMGKIPYILNWAATFLCVISTVLFILNRRSEISKSRKSRKKATLIPSHGYESIAISDKVDARSTDTIHLIPKAKGKRSVSLDNRSSAYEPYRQQRLDEDEDVVSGRGRSRDSLPGLTLMAPSREASPSAFREHI
ncbi:hypothetical protein BGZ60DRAFT_526230 [Tricladium varicosporioides]|nr:hypothetical protein BGZ60DRAFT_526230 [Hymenoscyphus varicosporioides]